MTVVELHKFMTRVQDDPSLRDAIAATNEQELPAVISELATRTGLKVEPEDVQQWMQPPPESDALEDAQLDAVAGGATTLMFSQPSPSLKNLEQNFGLFVPPSHPQPTWPGNLP